MDWLLFAFVFFLLSIAVGLLWALIGMATTTRRLHGRQEGWGKEE